MFFELIFNDVIKSDVWNINPRVKQIIGWHEACSMLLKLVFITFTNNRIPCTVGAYTIINGLRVNMCYVLWFSIVFIRWMWLMSWMCFELFVMYAMVCIPRLLCVCTNWCVWMKLNCDNMVQRNAEWTCLSNYWSPWQTYCWMACKNQHMFSNRYIYIYLFIFMLFNVINNYVMCIRI